MTKGICILSTLCAMGSLSACTMSQEKPTASPQVVVEFSEAEVPHILVVSKNGKMTAEIVDNIATKVSAK